MIGRLASVNKRAAATSGLLPIANCEMVVVHTQPGEVTMIRGKQREQTTDGNGESRKFPFICLVLQIFFSHDNDMLFFCTMPHYFKVQQIPW